MDLERRTVSLIGASGVGKSSILYRYFTGSIKEKIDPSIAVSFMSKIVSQNGISIKLDI